jgi:predicted ATPase
VLDNREHLLSVVAHVVGEVAQRCPHVRVLATSREGLNVAGERILGVASLGVPDEPADLAAVADCDAVRLFTDRAQAVKANFQLDATNAEAVAHVCRRLDGIALAIELAAARVAMLTPNELMRRVDQSFRLLAGGRRTAVERHQTLRAAIDWSYELLTPVEQLLLDRLSVFAGGFSLEAVELVTSGDGVDADNVFDLLASLVARSLVVAETDDLDARYRLLETIRQYAQEHLDGSGDGDLLRSRHAVYFAEFAESALPMFIGPEGLRWQHRFERDLDNLRAALSWAVEAHDVDPAVRLVAAWSSPFTPLNLSVRSTLGWAAETVLDLPGASEHAGYPAALVMAAWTAHWQGDLKLARRRCDEAVQAEQRLGTDPNPGIWHARSQIALAINDLDDALDCINRAADIFRARGDTAMLSFALGSSATTRALLGDTVRAIPEAEEAIALANRNRVNPALLVGTMAVASFALGDSDPARALALVRDALALIGPGERSYAWAVGGDVAVRNDKPTEALKYFVRSIDDMHWFGNRPILGLSIGRVADLVAESNAEAGAALHGAADLLAPEYVQAPHVIEARERAVAVETATLGAARRAELYARGISMDEDEIVALAQTASAQYLDEGHIDYEPRPTS